MMKPVGKTPLNKDDISNLIEMALQNKISWKALANILKDTTSFDPKKVVETLLKALEKLHLKMQEKDCDYEQQKDDSFPDEDDKEDLEDEGLNDETSIEWNGENEVVGSDRIVVVDSSIAIDQSIKEYNGKTMEDGNEFLEETKETIIEEMPLNTTQGIHDFNESDKEMKENVVSSNSTNFIDNEWYTFVSNEKISNPQTVVKAIDIPEEEEQELVDTNGQKKSFQCKFCQKISNTSWQLKIHERIHTGEVPYGCKTCKKRFCQGGDLKRHEKIHTNEKPFDCKTCHMRFTQRGNLKKHEIIHSEEKPFACKTCHKRCKRKADLNKHEKRHTGDLRYGCETCKKRFTQNSDLMKHERIHTGEVPYECKICKKRFSQTSNLKKHERKHK